MKESILDAPLVPEAQLDIHLSLVRLWLKQHKLESHNFTLYQMNSEFDNYRTGSGICILLGIVSMGVSVGAAHLELVSVFLAFALALVLLIGVYLFMRNKEEKSLSMNSFKKLEQDIKCFQSSLREIELFWDREKGSGFSHMDWKTLGGSTACRVLLEANQNIHSFLGQLLASSGYTPPRDGWKEIRNEGIRRVERLKQLLKDNFGVETPSVEDYLDGAVDCVVTRRRFEKKHLQESR